MMLENWESNVAKQDEGLMRVSVKEPHIVHAVQRLIRLLPQFGRGSFTKQYEAKCNALPQL